MASDFLSLILLLHHPWSKPWIKLISPKNLKRIEQSSRHRWRCTLFGLFFALVSCITPKMIELHLLQCPWFFFNTNESWVWRLWEKKWIWRETFSAQWENMRKNVILNCDYTFPISERILRLTYHVYFSLICHNNGMECTTCDHYNE